MIQIIATGKIPKEYRVIINDLIKRSSVYQKIDLIELKEVSLKSDESNLPEKLSRETEAALNRAKGEIYVLDADGKMFTTDEFTAL